MERLQVQNIGSTKIEWADNIDYSLDEKYKPGLYLQIVNLLNNDYILMNSIKQHSDGIQLYNKIANY